MTDAAPDQTPRSRSKTGAIALGLVIAAPLLAAAAVAAARLLMGLEPKEFWTDILWGLSAFPLVLLFAFVYRRLSRRTSGSKAPLKDLLASACLGLCVGVSLSCVTYLASAPGEAATREACTDLAVRAVIEPESDGLSGFHARGCHERLLPTPREALVMQATAREMRRELGLARPARIEPSP